MIQAYFIEHKAMPRTNENVHSPTTKVVKPPPKRGQIKVRIMTQFFKIVEDAGRALCSNEKVTGEETQPSQLNDSGH
ncbi:hypothetical protein L6164_009833 [Bauhinia variegata]|uniref:Uncharacterized protein n=1 Tax=Bauhinia variegata TaxID=167791 RepID=A0ACB9PKY9_BAUVA|nr:hypothetical protein L6164_009833 [Bauhinia variegata]